MTQADKREILFRGKRTDRDKWVQGYYVFNTNGFDFDDDEYKEYHRIQPLQPNGMLDIIREVYLETVGQYTGLTDKNGTKIFEGDILNTSNSNCRIWYVDYKNTAFCVNQGNANYSCVLDEFMQYSSVEVIGNIHDNPELLKGGADNG